MLLELLLVSLTVVVAAWWYSRWRHSYWASLGIPSKPGLPFIGNLHEGLLKPIWLVYDNIYKNYGGSKVCGRYEGFRPVLVIGDPDILRDVLVKDFDHFVDKRFFGSQDDDVMKEMVINKTGDEWKILRSILSPTFSSGKMKKMFPLVCDKADLLVSSCLKEAAQDPIIDMKDKTGRFTMDTIASCAFGIECNSFTKEKPEFAQWGDKFLSLPRLRFLQFILTIMFPKVASAIGIKLFASELEFFSEVARMTIKARETGPKRGDFLDLLLEARAEDSDSKNTTSSKHVLDDKTIVAQSVQFLVAGFDTAASTLALATHLLAQNPKEQTRLREELQELVKQEGELTYQGVMEAKYLDACVQETLRLYPPPPFGERICTKPYKVPGAKVVLKPGDLVQFPIWSLHHDPRYWPQPDRFRPDRFMPENKANIKHFTHMPFGLGPRSCLAMRFAQMEVKVALAKLVLVAEFAVAAGHEEIIIDTASFVLRPVKGSKLLLKSLNPVA